jgi:hypothetical protein
MKMEWRGGREDITFPIAVRGWLKNDYGEKKGENQYVPM